MKIELTEKEFEILKILIYNTNECESGLLYTGISRRTI